jgi:hypothetical protein
MEISLLTTGPRNCEKCGYGAENMYVVDAYTWEIDDDSIMCNLCSDTFDDTFDMKNGLMIHTKEDHTEKVEFCWHYSAENYPYGE